MGFRKPVERVKERPSEEGTALTTINEIQATSKMDTHTITLLESKQKGSSMVGLTTKEVTEQKVGIQGQGGFKGCKNGLTPSCFTGGRSGGGSDKVAGEPHGGKFEPGGAAESGSDGGPGNFAGNCRLGVGTINCGGIKKAVEGFAKDGSEACGCGGGPGLLIRGGIGSGHSGLAGSKDGGKEGKPS